MDITDLNLEKLKALAYDTIMEISRHQENLKILQAQIKIKTGKEND